MMLVLHKSDDDLNANRYSSMDVRQHLPENEIDRLVCLTMTVQSEQHLGLAWSENMVHAMCKEDQ